VLVYGDHREVADPREKLDALSPVLAAIAAMSPGLGRHARLVGALIEAGQLLQGVADEGSDESELNAFVTQLAVAVVRSWDSRFAEVGVLPPVPSLDLPRQVTMRLPEGFAFYAVYPEAYIESARQLALNGPPRVIGIRSIGTTLGAIVAAALNAPPPVTVRPFGDSFARRVELPPELVERDAHYVIVDEGPGLSGSSFGAVADWLQHRGVPLERIAFLPSHGGDVGSHASEAHRRRWREAQRVPGGFDERFLVETFGPLEELSTGHPWERRKFLATNGGERVLLKFAGLGEIGERKLNMARMLHAAGLTPKPIGLVHGFLVERWCGDATPLAFSDKPIEEIGNYIRIRARRFPADNASGATIEELITMCRRNISLALGNEQARKLDRFDAARLSARVYRVRTDNKLDRHEWLRGADGLLIKTDALDHHQAHDLVGCQDLAWDVAGAICEFGLDAHETERLIAATGGGVDAELLDFYSVAYSAFRLGQSCIAAEIIGTESAEGRRLKQTADGHARRLYRLLLLQECLPARIRQESLVD
jgi:hypothetical protein